MVAVVCGADDYRFEELAGVTVGVVRQELKALMNISGRAESRVDGVVVGPDYELTARDSFVEFVVRRGWKGGGDFVWMADDKDRLHRIAPEAVEVSIKRGFRVMAVADEVLDLGDGAGLLPMIAASTARTSQPDPETELYGSGKMNWRENESRHRQQQANYQKHAMPQTLAYPAGGRTSVFQEIAANLARIADRLTPLGLSAPQPTATADQVSMPVMPPAGKKKSPYMDAQEAADYLGITAKSLYGQVERRHIIPLRGPKGRYRFTREMLDEYLRR